MASSSVNLELTMVVELTRKATENLNEVEQLSSDLEETAEEDGENIARLLAEAASHLGQALALTPQK
ncbi:hypothetical protein PoB_004274700 [Plakobranchus ocellatus]|uniref:Uncharacterized protein n=1 Tax=Plakobranchus ocellatus TaxID=259542 RepID=A0AAV4BAP8_9GAST|nr:hypothetical protein PoB_004274700 [Plakobranchus ocellatus]